MRQTESEIPESVSQAYIEASIGAAGSENLDKEKDDETAGSGSDNSQQVVYGEFNGPRFITFDGDQTLYSDGANFDSNPSLASYLCQLLKQGVVVAVVTAAGYEYNVEKYEFRLSGLLNYFKAKKLTAEQCERFLLFGGECNYLLNVCSNFMIADQVENTVCMSLPTNSLSLRIPFLSLLPILQLGMDYRLHPVKETGRGGWITATKFLQDSPGNWSDNDVKKLLDVAEEAARESLEDQEMKGRIIRKKRSVGLVPTSNQQIPREALDETVLRCQAQLQTMNNGCGPLIPFCAFNGGRDVWVDVGNKRVGVEVLSAYLGIDSKDILHIGDQFLNTGNDYAARDVCPCVWVTSPEETTYVLKTILRFAGVSYKVNETEKKEAAKILSGLTIPTSSSHVDFQEAERRTQAIQEMDVFTGEMK